MPKIGLIYLLKKLWNNEVDVTECMYTTDENVDTGTAYELILIQKGAIRHIKPQA